MAQRFEATATGLMDAQDYRIEIYDKRYTNASIEGTLDDERQWITIPTGEGDDTGAEPLIPREFELTVFENEDLSVLRGAAEDDVRIEVYNTTSSTRIYKGYVDPNNIGRRPIGPQPGLVTLIGTEGLPTLGDPTVDTLSWATDDDSDDPVSIMKVIRTILNQVYPTSIDLEVGVHWYPAGGSLTSSDLSLQSRDVFDSAFREDRPEGGDWFTLLEALKQMLKLTGCTLQQTVRRGKLVWWIVEWGAYQSDGKIDTWDLPPNATGDGSDATYLSDQDVTVDLNALVPGRVEFAEEPETGERQRRDVTVTYDHPGGQNFVVEPGFEDGGGNFWFIDDSSVVAAGVSDHSNIPESPDPTTNDQKVALIRYDPDGTNDKEWPFEQSAELLIQIPEKKASLRFQVDHWQNVSFRNYLRLNSGSTYFGTTTSQIRADTLSGDVSLPVDSPTAPIGVGAKVPINSGGDFAESFIEVKERVKVGDTEITGNLSKDVSRGDVVHYVEPVGSQSRIPIFRFVDTAKTWGTTSIYVPAQDASGNQLTDQTLTIELGIEKASAPSSTVDWYFDNVRLQAVREGSVLNEVESTASVDQPGEEESFDQRFGSGPTQNTISRIDAGRKWGIDPQPTSPDIYPISELRARQRLRYFRETNKTYELNVLLEDGSPEIWGHEILQLNGDNFRVVQTEPTPSEGKVKVTALEHNDYGTS